MGRLVWTYSWLSLVLSLAACAIPSGDVLRIAAATSLRQPALELEQLLEPTTTVEVSIAASGTLVRQVEAGVVYDLLLAAAPWPIEELESQDLTYGSPLTLATNRLVVVSRDPALTLLRIANGGGQLAIGDPRYVPAGRYAQLALEQSQLLGHFEGRLVLAADVAAVAAHVQAGSVEAGFIYQTEAKMFPALHQVETAQLHRLPQVVAVRLAGGRTDLADRALQVLRSPAGHELFSRHGFEPQ